MATLTTNYEFVKADETTENYSVAVVNTNLDDVDTVLFAKVDKVDGKELSDNNYENADLATVTATAKLALVQTLTDGATIDWDVDKGGIAVVTLAGNRTLNNATNAVAGAEYKLIVKQDATGGRTLAFDTDYVSPITDAMPTLNSSPNGMNILMFMFIDDEMKLINLI